LPPFIPTISQQCAIIRRHVCFPTKGVVIGIPCKLSILLVCFLTMSNPRAPTPINGNSRILKWRYHI
jgi:hypothetical protein